MKNKKIIILTLIILIVFIIIITVQGCIIWNMKQEQNNKNNSNTINQNKVIYTETEDSKKFKQEYESLNNTSAEKDGEKYISVNIPKENPIIYVTLEELLNVINSDEKSYIYISRANSPFGRAIIEPLLNVLQDLGIEKLYYLDIGEGITFKDEAQKQEIMNQLAEKGVITKNEDGSDSWNIPLIAKTLSGKVLAQSTGTGVTYNEGQSYYSELTEDQKQEVYNEYYELLKD